MTQATSMSPAISAEGESNRPQNEFQYEYLDSRQFAARLNVPVSWAREHVRPRTSNPIPHMKFGKYVRFAWGSPELESWLKRHMVGAKNSKVVRSSGKERIQ